MDFVSKDKGKKEMQELFQTSNVQHANNFEDIPQKVENGWRSAQWWRRKQYVTSKERNEKIFVLEIAVEVIITVMSTEHDYRLEVDGFLFDLEEEEGFVNWVIWTRIKYARGTEFSSLSLNDKISQSVDEKQSGDS